MLVDRRDRISLLSLLRHALPVGADCVKYKDPSDDTVATYECLASNHELCGEVCVEKAVNMYRHRGEGKEGRCAVSTIICSIVVICRF
jgi:hypothetical protein